MIRSSFIRSLCGRTPKLLLLGGLAALGLPSVASATTVYWAQEARGGTGAGIFSLAPGATTAREVFGESNTLRPEGVALDPADGRVYWTDASAGEILVGGLGGAAEGPPTVLYEGLDDPVGIAVDPATGKLYWAEATEGDGVGVLFVGDVGGEGEGPAELLEGSEPLKKYEREPLGLALDTTTGQLFWTYATTAGGQGEVWVGTLEAGGTRLGQAKALYAKEQEEPGGVVVDEATGKLYWTVGKLGGTSEIREGGLSGEPVDGSHAFYALPPATVPYGLALDPTAQRLYWDDYEDGAIQTMATTGQSEPEPLITTVAQGPNLLALMGAPAAAGAPIVSGAAVGQPLSCSGASWAGDLPQAQYYDAPQSLAYAWLRNGASIAGASAASFTPSEGGSYSCAVTASNSAGATTQASAAVSVAQLPPPQQTPPPSSPASSAPKLAITALAKLAKSGKQAVTISCSGASCTGSLTLTTVVKTAAKGKHKAKSETVKLASASYRLAAGATETLQLKLTSKALKLLAQSKGKLSAKLTASVNGGTSASRTLTLRLAPAKKKGAGKGPAHSRRRS